MKNDRLEHEGCLETRKAVVDLDQDEALCGAGARLIDERPVRSHL